MIKLPHVDIKGEHDKLTRLTKDAPMNKSDKLLLERLHERYYRLMIYIAERIIPDASMVEDAVADSFVKIIRHRQKFYNMECHQEKAYIVSIIRSTSINMKAQRERLAKREADVLTEDMPAPDMDALDRLTAKEGYDALVAAILSLPDKLRDVAYHYYSYKMTHEEIADKMGISVSASKKRLERAKRKISEQLGGKNNA